MFRHRNVEKQYSKRDNVSPRASTPTFPPLSHFSEYKSPTCLTFPPRSNATRSLIPIPRSSASALLTTLLYSARLRDSMPRRKPDLLYLAVSGSGSLPRLCREACLRTRFPTSRAIAGSVTRMLFRMLSDAFGCFRIPPSNARMTFAVSLSSHGLARDPSWNKATSTSDGEERVNGATGRNAQETQ